MKQGELEVVKQEMERVNIDILGISELNGLEWVNLIQMTIISTTEGKNSSWSIKVWKAVLGCNLKNDRMISVPFQGKPFNITVIQVYYSNTNAEETEV